MQNKYPCSYCPKILSTFSGKENHEIIMHILKKKPHENARYFCNVCDKSSVKLTPMKVHVYKIHGIKDMPLDFIDDRKVLEDMLSCNLSDNQATLINRLSDIMNDKVKDAIDVNKSLSDIKPDIINDIKNVKVKDDQYKAIEADIEAYKKETWDEQICPCVNKKRTCTIKTCPEVVMSNIKMTHADKRYFAHGHTGKSEIWTSYIGCKNKAHGDCRNPQKIKCPNLYEKSNWVYNNRRLYQVETIFETPCPDAPINNQTKWLIYNSGTFKANVTYAKKETNNRKENGIIEEKEEPEEELYLDNEYDLSDEEYEEYLYWSSIHIGPKWLYESPQTFYGIRN